MYRLKVWLKELFTYPKMATEKVDYDAYWFSKRGYEMGTLSDWQIERADFVVKVLQNKENVSLSDIGCGEGSIISYIGGKISATELLGTDISDRAIEQARHFGIKVKKLDVGKIEELSHIPEADYQLLFEILEHVPHSEELLKVAITKAQKGVFFSFPNTGFLTHRLRLFFGKFPLQWRLFPGEHVRFWTRADLLWWLKSLGLTHYSIHYYKGVPVLNKLCPSLFAAGFIVHIKKDKFL